MCEHDKEIASYECHCEQFQMSQEGVCNKLFIPAQYFTAIRPLNIHRFTQLRALPRQFN